MVPLPQLVLRQDLHPRYATANGHIDRIGVYYLTEFLRVHGIEALAPVVVERRSMVLVDGYQRVQAVRAVYGADACVPVEWVECDSDAAIFLEAVRRNAQHGLKLTGRDYAFIVLRARELGVRMETLESVTGIRREVLDQFVVKRVTLDAEHRPFVLGYSQTEVFQGCVLSPHLVAKLRRSEGRSMAELARQLAVLVAHADRELVEKRREVLEHLYWVLHARLHY